MKKLLFVVIFAFSSFVSAQNVNTFIPENCQKLKPVVIKENQTMMPKFKDTWYFSSLIEHESCIHLKHSRCCSPNSKLDTKRELAIGVGQLTVAYNPDGSVRFDALSDLKTRYKDELRELSWTTIKDRVDLQVRAVVLLSRSNYNQFFTVQHESERIKMMDSAYNGGARGVLKARTACGLAANCNPHIWDDNVERYINKSTKPLYAGRSALEINLHHVKDVTKIRKLKYEQMYAQKQ